MTNIQTIEELWTDGITDLGIAREVKFHMKVRYDDGSKEWHYYGTVAPTMDPPAVQHPASHFPTDFLNLPDVEGLLYDLALSAGNVLMT